MRQVVELSLTAALFLRMVHAGFLPPVGRAMSWPMYAWATAVIVTTEVAQTSSPTGERVVTELYRAIPRGEFMVGPDQLDDYVQYLRERYPEVTCSGVAYGPFGERAVGIVDGHVAVS
ncbi:hypothetical protein ABH930_000485 [Kitasatospora sp. GAS204A]|uniref:hypothetical protein n=1 Tax=unclassified Kitasatospora TaxID=2633591 RepID=UPI0024747384|nr:hypothetical protein [Kitasatospora sp. GAS204B]MDH6117066.1 hypothetical protein [Kitasatospora sp. GAS204B]